ncbi:MAG: LamG domain-containing protein, partial [Candidatus Omnitrophica bacterium]|nr:LamG domain-containing protein [Candidatus Omnitrophota bacterium]
MYAKLLGDEEDLVAYYSMDDGTGLDNTGRGNNGTVRGSPAATYYDNGITLLGVKDPETVTSRIYDASSDVLLVDYFGAGGNPRYYEYYTSGDMAGMVKSIRQETGLGEYSVTEYEYYTAGSAAGEVKKEITGEAEIMLDEKVMSFNGSNGYINVGNMSDLRITGSQTIEMWINPANLNQRYNPYEKSYGGEGTITLETDGSVNYYYGINGNNGGTYQGFGSGAGTVAINEWTHIVIVRDLSAMKLRWYKNGELVAETDAQFAAAAVSTQDVRIGYGYTGYYFNGKLDDIAVWSKALTSQEIAERYNGIQLTGSETGLAALYQFNDGTASDSARDNNGTLSGGVTVEEIKKGTGEFTDVYTEYFYSEDGRVSRRVEFDGVSATEYNYSYMNHSEGELMSKVIDFAGTLILVTEDLSGDEPVYTFSTGAENMGSGRIGSVISMLDGNRYVVTGTSLDDIGLGQVGLVFDGSTGDYMRPPREAVHGLGDFTFTFDAKLDMSQRYQMLLSGANSSSDNEILLQYDRDSDVWSVYVGGTAYNLPANSIVEDGAWHSLVLKRSGSVLYLYIDGRQVASVSASAKILNVSEGGFFIGLDQDSVGGGFASGETVRGAIDRISIWSRALSNEEIGTIGGGASPDTLSGFASDCRVYWDLNSLSGGVVPDLTANGYNSTTAGLTYGPAMTSSVSVQVVKVGDELIKLGGEDSGKLLAVESYAGKAKITGASATYSQTDYSIFEAIDGVKTGTGNGWSVDGRQGQSAMFVLENSPEVDNLVITHGIDRTGYNIADFEIYYTLDETPDVTKSLWIPVTGAYIKNLITGGYYSENGNRLVAGPNDQDIYDIGFDAVKMTAIRIKVNDSNTTNHNFVMTEVELYGTLNRTYPAVYAGVSVG